MRWIKIIFYTAIVLLTVYAVSMLFVDESKTYDFTEDLPFPIGKVSDNFENMQHFSEWKQLTEDDHDLSYTFYSPYRGTGSSLHFVNRKDSLINGDVFLRYANPPYTFKYQIFSGRGESPYTIDIKLQKKSDALTRVFWKLSTPKQPLLRRSAAFFSDDEIRENFDHSMSRLRAVLSGKVDRENMLGNIQYDSVVVEQQPERLLLGLNSSAAGKKEILGRSVELTYAKLHNFLTKDLGRKESEFGETEMITALENFRENHVSYFLGVAVKDRQPLNDNSFTYRNLPASRALVIYYKGNYAGMINKVELLARHAKDNGYRPRELVQTFLTDPGNDDTIIKLSLYTD